MQHVDTSEEYSRIAAKKRLMDILCLLCELKILNYDYVLHSGFGDVPGSVKSNMAKLAKRAKATGTLYMLLEMLAELGLSLDEVDMYRWYHDVYAG